MIILMTNSMDSHSTEMLLFIYSSQNDKLLRLGQELFTVPSHKNDL